MIPVSIVVYWMMIFWLKQSDTWKLKQSNTVSMVVYWMMIFWLKQSDTWKLKQSDTCVNGGLLNDDILIKTKWYLEIKTKWYLCQSVYWMMIFWLKQSDMSIVVYWMMIFWLKQSDTWKLKQSGTCVNGGLLNDDILIKTKCVNGGLLNDDTLIKTKWYLEIKTKWYLCQWWFIEWWYFD